MTSVKKTLKTLVWSDRSLTKFSLKITTKLAFFFSAEFAPENSCKIGQFFREFAPENPAKFDFFSATYQKPCIVWCDPSDLKILWIEVGINLEVNWLCLCDLAHFYDESKGGSDEMFVLTLLF